MDFRFTVPGNVRNFFHRGDSVFPVRATQPFQVALPYQVTSVLNDLIPSDLVIDDANPE